MAFLPLGKAGCSNASLQPTTKNSDTRHNQYQPQKTSNTKHNQYHSNDTNLPMDCFLRPSGTVTGAENDDSSCLTSGVVFSEKSSGVDSFGAMMVSETSPVEVDIVLVHKLKYVNYTNFGVRRCWLGTGKWRIFVYFVPWKIPVALLPAGSGKRPWKTTSAQFFFYCCPGCHNWLES